MCLTWHMPKDQTALQDRLVPTSSVAKQLNVDVRTVHRMVRVGRLSPAVKAPGLRGAMLFNSEDVAALAAERGSAVSA